MVNENERAHLILEALMSPSYYYAKYYGQPATKCPQTRSWQIHSKIGDGQRVIVYDMDALYQGSEPDFEECE